jgi:hypothetical protein
LPTSTSKSKPDREWNSYLVTKLREVNFKQSLIDNCIFYQDNVIFIVYVDNGIFLGPSDQQLRDIINKLRNHNLSIEDQGHPADYVGVSIKKLKNGVIELTQRALIDSIISDVALDDSKVKAVPAKVSKILHAHLDKPPFSLNFVTIWSLASSTIWLKLQGQILSTQLINLPSTHPTLENLMEKQFSI